MNVGDKVKYIVETMEYLGIIIAKDTSEEIYFVSVDALGSVIKSDGSNIEKI